MGTRTKVHWDGDVNFTYQERDLVATVSATAEHWYQAGRRYMPNGDPGYPEEDEIDDVNFEVTVVRDAETDETVVYVEDMYDYVDAAIQETAEWEDDEPDEPDYDDYDDAAVEHYEADCIRMGY